jgi:Domain of unknown function (DUF4158)
MLTENCQRQNQERRSPALTKCERIVAFVLDELDPSRWGLLAWAPGELVPKRPMVCKRVRALRGSEGCPSPRGGLNGGSGVGAVPESGRALIAGQLGLLWDVSEAYRWDSRTRGQHLFDIRQHTGWRFPTGQDKNDLERWLRREAACEVQDVERLMEYACQRLRHLRVELPVERELQRIVDAALNGFFQDISRRIADSMTSGGIAR